MPKVTLTFPNPDSLWLFKERSTAINIAVAPAKNRITGLFPSAEIDIAVAEFQAVQTANAAANCTPSGQRYTEIRSAKSFSKFKFYHLLSMIKF